MPKNLTLSIEEDLLDKARVLAAMKRTSVNEMVREFLARVVREEQERDESREQLLELIDRSPGDMSESPGEDMGEDMGAWRPSREETYSGEPRFDRWK
ncbi:MAG: DUF6364 family protein [Pseudomonadota bacterium]